MAKRSVQIGSVVYEVNHDTVDQDVLDSIRRWYTVKKDENKNYCPFICVHRSCSSLCHAIFNFIGFDSKDCLIKKLGVALTEALIEELIYDTDDKKKKRTTVGWTSAGVQRKVVEANVMPALEEEEDVNADPNTGMIYI